MSVTIAWKDNIVKRLTGGVRGLLRKNKVRMIEGWATFLDGKTIEVKTANGAEKIHAENVVIATGSIPVELPFMPFDGDVISSTHALDLKHPPKKLAVVGAGYIGLELGIAFAKMGSEVSIVEAMDRILPLYDDALTKPVADKLASLGIKIYLGAKAKAKVTGGLEIELATGDVESLAADKVLVTVGRAPLSDGWGREALHLEMNDRFIAIDEQCRTSMRGVFAIGDVTGEPMLAHRAMAQGEMVAEIIAGHSRKWDKRAIAAVCFTDPEIVSVGLSPDEATANGIDVKSEIFPFAANGLSLIHI